MALDDSGRIHVSWTNYNTVGHRFVYYAKSTDGGRSFLPPVRAADSLCGDQYGLSSIAVSRSGRRVCVVRAQASRFPANPYRIILSRSTDGGTTFLRPDIQVSPDTWVLRSTVATLFDSIVLVAWDKPDSGLGYFARSVDGGASFQPQKRLGPSGDPSLAVDDSGRVFMASDGPQLRVSEDAGDSFGPATWIPNEGNGGLQPSIWASRSGQLCVTYWYFGDAFDVRFAFSPNAGDTFFAPVNPSRASYLTDEYEAVVAANDSGSVFVAWTDDRSNPSSLCLDVYCAAGAMSAIEETRPAAATQEDFSIAPSPTRGEVRINFRAADPGRATVRVLDEAGRTVAVLSHVRPADGQGAVCWSGRDEVGSRLASGVYFVVLETPDGIRSRKLEIVSE
jgi:hypothetical protein